MTLPERDDVRGRCVPESVAIREPRTERRTMTKAVRSDRKRVVVAEAEDQTYHRKGWYELVEAPAGGGAFGCPARAARPIRQPPSGPSSHGRAGPVGLA